MPALHGGEDGSALTRDLLSAGFGSAMLLLSGYSNPAAVLDHAHKCGYVVADFLVQPLPFGEYTSQDVVTAHLRRMRAAGTAFWRNGGAGRRPYYFLAGVLFERRRCPALTARMVVVRATRARPAAGQQRRRRRWT